MFRVTSLMLPTIALCIFLLAHQGFGSRLRPTIQEIIAHQTSVGGPNDNYYGLQAITDVYGHDLKTGQLSATIIWVHHTGDGSKSSLNTIQVGWHIHPERYGDTRTHLFAYWTRDGYETTGCFNRDCPGFITAKGATVSLGAIIDPVSDLNGGSLQNVTLKLLKEKTSGDWWVYYGFNSVPTAVGYYPSSLFTNLAKIANTVSFGAYVSVDRAQPTPPLGSGASPNDGQGHAASFSDMQTIDVDGTGKPIMEDLPSVAKCYSIAPVSHGKFFYGGPGGCA
ncbi:unnamed protein product [Triticum turgidum subsp. durum]|uniref:Neprosin PEP catalytic domain-containing protein n=1 Tax=Triticum turgidum subsp. durum TaxID=4567 RepID=A0A9R0Q0C6_TRITD|nr:unnamed protein product [Triticum turgidum subsp. durum]